MKLDRDRDALVIIDVQYDFLPGGALGVAGGLDVIAPINRLMPAFAHVVAAQDWHPADHVSFAANHPGAAPFSQIELSYGAQTLWPVHCVQGTPGAAYHRDVDLDRVGAIVRKGWRQSVDSYSGFFENDHKTPTGLGGLLRERGVGRIFVTGLATDYCVGFSALDARKLGFEVHVVLDACAGLDVDGSLARTRAAWTDAGVGVVQSGDLVG